MNPQPTVDNVDILWIVGTFVGLAMLYWLLWKGTRTLGRAIAVRDHGDAKRRLARGQEHLGWIVIAYSALVIVAVPVLFYRVYEDRLLEGLIAAVALLWFLRSQLPTLLPPSVYIGFHHWDRDQQRYMEPASEGDCVQHSVDTFLVLRVMNVGLGAYEGCSVSITLRKDFHITEWAETEESIYSQVDFAKPFSLQRQNNAARFVADASLTLHPGDSVFYPVHVRTPDSICASEAAIEFSSKSSWSQITLRRQIRVGLT